MYSNSAYTTTFVRFLSHTTSNCENERANTSRTLCQCNLQVTEEQAWYATEDTNLHATVASISSFIAHCKIRKRDSRDPHSNDVFLHV